MSARFLAVSGLLGLILGAVVAYIGITVAFVCRVPVNRYGSIMCPEPDVPLALMWGAPIGLAVGLIAGFVLSKRQSSN
jgi:hypothetical protein